MDILFIVEEIAFTLSVKEFPEAPLIGDKVIFDSLIEDEEEYSSEQMVFIESNKFIVSERHWSRNEHGEIYLVIDCIAKSR